MSNTYDDALQLLAETGPEYGEGSANDGPIVAAYLVAMEQPQAVLPWVKAYRTRLEHLPPPGTAITRNSWRGALGDWSRVGDWVPFFQRELNQASWQRVVGDWAPRLAPGLSGASGHALIRTAVALDHLNHEDSELRRDELAQSLAYWASRYLKLPGILGSSAAGKLAPSEALERVKWQHKDRPPQLKNLSAGLQKLVGFPSFAGVINLVLIPKEPVALISQITEAMARVYLANSHMPEKLLPFIHAVTVPAAIRHVIPHVRPDQVVPLVRYGWQFAGAMYAIYGRANPVEQWDHPRADRAELITRAIAGGNEHAILFTGTCLEEFDESGSPVYLAAAADAMERLTAPISETGDESEAYPGQGDAAG
ncbi:MAG: questin oxidase family protein [Candidatus Neomarinimicrobiota bacterium]